MSECKIHLIIYSDFWKKSDGINYEDLFEGLYNCLKCGQVIDPWTMNFKVVKEKHYEFPISQDWKKSEAKK